ncbi:MAG: hypothetical protein H7A25_21335 [Leptospiraceae bacterium]|nr:hypothetical protein [Leptospiraceae bacterium]
MKRFLYILCIFLFSFCESEKTNSRKIQVEGISVSYHVIPGKASELFAIANNYEEEIVIPGIKKQSKECNEIKVLNEVQLKGCLQTYFQKYYIVIDEVHF